ncbi:hypothetical protein V8E55_004288 [Tylopilus felleus]
MVTQPLVFVAGLWTPSGSSWSVFGRRPLGNRYAVFGAGSGRPGGAFRGRVCKCWKAWCTERDWWARAGGLF